jgi:photoactive yellow protein
MVPMPVLMSLLEQLPVGVVLLDARGRVVQYNRYEEVLAGRSRDEVLGREFFRDVAPCMNVRELGGRFYEEIGRTPIALQLEFSFPFPHLAQPREVVAKLTSFEVGGAPYGCLLIEDVSAKRAVERMKDTLGSLLVHDLKNPLSVALTNLGMLREQASVLADPEARECLDGAVRATNRVQRMVHNLLDVARLESPSLPIQRADVDVRRLVTETAHELRTLANLRGVSIHVETPDTPLVAHVDEDVLRRALDNVIENGVRYARTRVTLRVESSASALRFVVVDDGPGVPESVRERIFDKFAQVQGQIDGPRRRLNQGLGLTFVRLAVRAHGGTVSVGDPPGGGCAFTLEVPMVPQRLAARSVG